MRKSQSRRVGRIARASTLVALTSWVFTALPAEAEFFRYRDDQGRMHVVTDMGDVPEAYREQVKRHGLTPAKKRAREREQQQEEGLGGWLRALLAPEEKVQQQVGVELYVKGDCKNCKELAEELRAQGVNYVKVDVEKNHMGAQIFATFNRQEFPAAKVGDRVYFGYKPDEIAAAARGMEPPDPKSAKTKGINKK